MLAGNTRGENRGEGSESAWQKMIQDGGMREAATAKFNRTPLDDISKEVHLRD